MITASVIGFFQGLGAWEIGVIIIVLGLIFGASRIPEIGANLGKGIKNFRRSFTDAEDEDEEESKKLEGEKKQAEEQQESKEQQRDL
ncbi:MAG: twin-arginine translocase TatA/TatE family subunit [bacterium]